MLAPSLSAQNLAVKTNLLYDATATINAGFETGSVPNGRLTFRAIIMDGT